MRAPAARGDDGAARHAHYRLVGREQRAASLEAEIDLGGIRMAGMRAGLPRLPAGDGDVAALDGAEDVLDMDLRIEMLLVLKRAYEHDGRSPLSPGPCPVRDRQALVPGLPKDEVSRIPGRRCALEEDERAGFDAFRSEEHTSEL